MAVIKLLVCFIVLSSMSPAMALQPPAVDAELTTCDPIRQEILRINQRPAWISMFFQPRVAMLKRRYGKCFQALQTEEFDYLKQAEIPGHAGPKLPEFTPNPHKKHWWQR